MGCTLAATAGIAEGAVAGRRAVAGHDGRRKGLRGWATAAAGHTCGCGIAAGGATARGREWPRAWSDCPGPDGDSWREDAASRRSYGELLPGNTGV